MSDASDSGDVRDRVRERFGARSNEYRTSAVHSAGEDLDLLVKLVAISPGDRALDIATGAGHTALALARAGAQVVASDITPAMLAEALDNAKTHGVQIDTALADAAKLPFEDASFDIVTARMAPHHFPDPAAFVREVARVLRAGGRFVIEDQVAPDDLAGAAIINEFEVIRDPSHNKQLAVADWEALALAAGLEVASAPVFSKWVDFDWWTSIQNVSEEDRARISTPLADGPQSARDWYTPEFRESGLVERFCIPHVIMLATKPR
jgi:SAM-dependent methyltransferase